MRPTEVETVIESIGLLNEGRIPSPGTTVALLMALRDDATGSLLDLAHCAAHRVRNEGRAHTRTGAFVELMLETLLGSEAKGGRVQTLHPIREVMGDINTVLVARNIEPRLTPRNQPSRLALAWSIASALHETTFVLSGGRQARLSLDEGTDGYPRMAMEVHFPEFGRIVLCFPWLLDEKDRTADWGQTFAS